MLSDKDAAESDHHCPKEYPCSIDLSPADGACRLAAAGFDEPFLVQPKAYCAADCKTECVGGMGGEETETACGAFKDIQATSKHEFIVQWTNSAHQILDEIRELVTETEGGYSSQSDDQATLPAQSPDEQGNNDEVHRNPYMNL